MSPLALSQTEAQRKVGRGGCCSAMCLCSTHATLQGVLLPWRRLHGPGTTTSLPSPLHFPHCVPQVLDRRPSVPKLPLGRLLSGDQGAHLPAVAVAADEAAAVAAMQRQPSRPAVPRLALSKLNPLAAGASGGSSQAAPAGGSGRGGSGSGGWRPTAQASRIPAANFSTMDATAQRSPSKLPSGEAAALAHRVGCWDAAAVWST